MNAGVSIFKASPQICTSLVRRDTDDRPATHCSHTSGDCCYERPSENHTIPILGSTDGLAEACPDPLHRGCS